MRFLYSCFAVVLLLPALALAQTYSNAPMVVVGAETPQPAATPAAEKTTNDLPNLPEQAITQVGGAGKPQAPSAAKSTAPAKPAVVAAPAISKLWPSNTLQIFMPRCTALKVQFATPCRCVITKLMSAMPHDEFLARSEDGTIEQDPRLIRIRTECATAPQRKK